VTRVLVVSRSAVARAGLEALLRADPGLAVSSSPDLAAAEADLIVLDWDRADDPELPEAPVPVVLLAGLRDAGWIRDAVRSGAHAVLPRDASREELLAAVQAASSGLTALAPEALEALLAPAPRPALAPAEELTPREIEVLRLLADGDGNKEIAWKLGISEHTVKFHVTSILAKLNAASRTEAVTIGLRRGLILL
jgi:NarL family two-component system response regulator YdfI